MIERPGCMTNPFYIYRPGEANMVEAMTRLRECGYTVMDLNMCPMQRNACEFCEDDGWEKYVDAVGDAAARLGITFVQSHPPYPKAPTRRKSLEDNGSEYNEFFLRMMKRALEIDARLGIPWAVMHPVSGRYKPDIDAEADLAFNLEYYAPLYEIGASRGVGFAFENMADVDGRRRFGSVPEDLIALFDAFPGEKKGICWDTGHGNRQFVDQLPALEKVAPRLVCTHIDDNVGEKDLHQLPFMGTVNWRGVMKILKESGYEGAFIYEISLFKNLPDPLKAPLARYAYGLAEYILAL